MSDLTATNCGCNTSTTYGNNGCGCGNNFIWIILLLSCCGGNNGLFGGGNGCGNSCGNGCGMGFGGGNSCEWLIWILLISCFCGGGNAASNNDSCGCGGCGGGCGGCGGWTVSAFAPFPWHWSALPCPLHGLPLLPEPSPWVPATSAKLVSVPAVSTALINFLRVIILCFLF